MQEQTSRIMKLAVRYLLASDVKTKDGKPRCYEEQLVLDRNTHSITYTQATSPRYQITKTCYVEDGIARLLDELDPELFSETPDSEQLAPCVYAVPRYQIMISFEDGTEQIYEGIFDELGLPCAWEDFLYAVKRFTRPLHHDELFDSNGYRRHYRREGDLIVCQVSFDFSMRTYTYLAHDDVYEEYDAVIVPVGSANEEKQAYIESVRYCKKEEINFPFDKLKYIIRKIDEDDDRYD